MVDLLCSLGALALIGFTFWSGQEAGSEPESPPLTRP